MKKRGKIFMLHNTSFSFHSYRIAAEKRSCVEKKVPFNHSGIRKEYSRIFFLGLDLL